MKRFLLVGGWLILTGCTCEWRGQPTVVTATGTRICAKHRTVLIAANGFRRELYYPDMSPDHLPVAVDKVHARCPNAVPTDDVLHDPHLGEAFKPVQITYCPDCEREA